MSDEPGSTLGSRLESVRSQIAEAAVEAGRSADDLTTIVVTKFHPASLVRELAGLGVREVGENRVQDAAPKAEQLRDLDVTWHFIGQLQSNKVRQVLAFSRIVHSLDRVSLLDALTTAADETSPVRVFIQLNLTEDQQRGGVRPDDLLAFAEQVVSRRALRLEGLMAVAPLGEEPRSAFARVREASGSLQTIAPGATALSMGMSGDFREAILEGATHLRIGTAITGNRPDAG